MSLWGGIDEDIAAVVPGVVAVGHIQGKVLQCRAMGGAMYARCRVRLASWRNLSQEGLLKLYI